MTARLQRWIDTASLVSTQRWAFGVVAVVSIVGALVFTSVGTDDRFGWFAVLTVGLAIVATVEAGSHTAAVVIGLVVLQWMSATDDVTTVRSLPVALCLLVFHCLLASMAVTPHSATVHPDVLRRWLQRTGAVAIGTGVVWLLVGALERRDAPADPQLTALALVATGAGVVLLLRQSLVDVDD